MRPTAAAVEDIPHAREVCSWVACAKRIAVGDAVQLLNPEVLLFAQQRQKLAPIAAHSFLADLAFLFTLSWLQIQFVVQGVRDLFPHSAGRLCPEGHEGSRRANSALWESPSFHIRKPWTPPLPWAALCSQSSRPWHRIGERTAAGLEYARPRGFSPNGQRVSELCVRSTSFSVPRRA